MIRIFIPPEELISDEIIIRGDNARHLSLVLRVHAGESIAIFDGQGSKYDCTVQTVHKKEVVARLNKKSPYSVESPLPVILAQGMTKGEKMDLIVQKSTELGVRKIIPVITERSQVRDTHKVERWRKIILSASQQSGRDKIPEIEGPVTFTDFLNSCSPFLQERIERSLKLIFSESQEKRNLKKVLSGMRAASQVILIIGPEGGFSRNEVMAAADAGFVEVSLGQRILRTETASIAALSIIQYELGDIG